MKFDHILSMGHPALSQKSSFELVFLPLNTKNTQIIALKVHKYTILWISKAIWPCVVYADCKIVVVRLTTQSMIKLQFAFVFNLVQKSRNIRFFSCYFCCELVYSIKLICEQRNIIMAAGWYGRIRRKLIKSNRLDGLSKIASSLKFTNVNLLPIIFSLTNA